MSALLHPKQSHASTGPVKPSDEATPVSPFGSMPDNESENNYECGLCGEGMTMGVTEVQAISQANGSSSSSSSAGKRDAGGEDATRDEKRRRKNQEEDEDDDEARAVNEEMGSEPVADRDPKRRRELHEPSREAREKHELSGHIPYRPWCRACVAGRKPNWATSTSEDCGAGARLLKSMETIVSFETAQGVRVRCRWCSRIATRSRLQGTWCR